MIPRRRDHKNRLLREGESQDKDGRYRYTYYENRKQKSIYSWKLEPTDKVPVGKKECEALQTQIERTKRRQHLFGRYSESSYTVLDLVERYVGLKTGVRKSTQAGYKTVLNILKKEPFGSRKISDIRVSDAKLWLIQMQKAGRGYSTIHNIRGVVRPAFQMAVDDDILLKNLFDFQLVTVIINDSIRREAITKKQERDFLKFIKDDPYYSKYYEGIYILFKTGMRISEFCGLTLRDIDMKERTIDIDHQLQRLSDMEYLIEPTKTNAGTRVLPMTPDVCRHTYCTNMALAGMNPKTLQYLMGHSEIGVTLDVYTHMSFEDARDELEKMNIV